MTHTGLPVPGYRAQDDDAIAMVTAMKHAEERLLRQLEDLRATGKLDQRWLAVGRTSIEQGFMAINRAIFQPGRVTLPEDER